MLILIALPMFTALIGWLIGKRFPRVYYALALVCTVLEFLLSAGLCFVTDSECTLPGLVDLGLSFSMDGFRHIYTVVISFMWMMTMMLSRDYFGFSKLIGGHHGPHPHTERYFFYNLMTLGATMGVFLSADLFTALVFFEVMSFTSFPWVIQEETEGAIRAAYTYLAIAVLGGLAALMGLFLLWNELGTLRIDELYTAAAASSRRGLLYTAGACVLFGFGAKAGMFPLHIWLPKAHPVAPAPASALLSGVLTKAGVFGIIAISCRLFRDDPVWGMLILSLGTVTMLLGAVLALFSNNLKRTLACSSMSQIGFILIGIGCTGLLGRENALASSGALLHMVNHSMFKLILFMCAGVVFMNTEELDLNKIRGFGRRKPLLNVCFLLGAAGIGGIPGLSGYISKTLLHEGIVEAAAEYGVLLHVVEWIFLISGGLTLAYMTKLYVCLFVEKGAYEEKKKYAGVLTVLALLGASIVIPVLGLTPHLTMDRIAASGTGFFDGAAMEHAVSYFSFENLKGAGISLAVGALVYFTVVRKWMMKENAYVDRWPGHVDLEDRIYRPLLLKWLPGFFGKLSALFGENQLTGPAASAVFGFSKVLSHAFSDSTDGLVYALRRTVLQPDDRNFEERVNHTYVYRFGAWIDRIRARHGKTSPEEHYFARLFDRVRISAERATHNLTDTLSFALFMLCVAICAVMVYILIIRN